MEKRGKKGGERIRETERDFFEGGGGRERKLEREREGKRERKRERKREG